MEVGSLLLLLRITTRVEGSNFDSKAMGISYSTQLLYQLILPASTTGLVIHTVEIGSQVIFDQSGKMDNFSKFFLPALVRSSHCLSFRLCLGIFVWRRLGALALELVAAIAIAY
ncbi:hypothetical protein Syun_002204 [Stephania yunnanensis]|uniref:Uncharacterized protein n=1 Tax=Stephania yunnanensis TaxID=152371 RepID=A0AAP0Q8K2_9MAGN